MNLRSIFEVLTLRILGALLLDHWRYASQLALTGLLTTTGLFTTTSVALAQSEEGTLLQGQALLGDEVLSNGIVVLHHLIGGIQGELDSVPLGIDGTFSLTLPNPPDPAVRDIYLASIRHDGVLYFGAPLTEPEHLDSIYNIQTYDTAFAPSGGVDLPIEIRNMFFEFDGDRWHITDLIEVYNETGRTLVSEDQGFVWGYPLIPGATDFELGQAEMSPENITLEAGELRIRTPLPPGERLFVVTYMIDEPFVSIPMPGLTAVMELLVREPAPPMRVEGLDSFPRIELEPGTTYRRYSGDNLADLSIDLSEAQIPFEVPVAWMSVILGLVLGGAGLFLLKRDPVMGNTQKATIDLGDRKSTLHQIALLDEIFKSQKDRSEREHKKYLMERTKLIQRVIGTD